MSIEDEDFLPLVRAYLEATDGLSHYHDRERVGGTLADRKTAARQAVYAYLVDRGWTPPPDVATGLRLDELVTQLSEGALAANTSDVAV